MRVLVFASICTAIALSACEGWTVNPIPYSTPTVLPSRPAEIRSPTPIILAPSSGTPPASTLTETASPVTATSTTVAPATETFTATPPALASTLTVDILGCDTSIDILHGMGEVTNAYVTLANSTGADATNVCATLRGLDEGRPHPDKTKCMASLPAGFATTLKLTVDTTYQQGSPIQIEVTIGDALILRAGEPACTAIGLLPPDMGDFGKLRRIP